jgi:hypothetical protein
MTRMATAELTISDQTDLAPLRHGRASNYVRCAPGQSVAVPRSGDVILIRGRGWLGRLIRGVQRVRYRREEDHPFAYWSHAALVVTPWHLIEVIPAGVIMHKIEKYRDHDYHYVYLELSESGRSKAVAFAYSCLRQKYGVSSFLLLAASVLLGDRFKVPDRGQHGCVALIVRALQRAGMTFEQRPNDMMPADLAKRFGVVPNLDPIEPAAKAASFLRGLHGASTGVEGGVRLSPLRRSGRWNRRGRPTRLFSPRPFTREERDRVEILFGGLHWRAERVIQAVFENLGYRARPLPAATKDDLLSVESWRMSDNAAQPASRQGTWLVARVNQFERI